MTPAEAKARIEALPGGMAPRINAALDTVAETVANEARQRLGPMSPSRPGDPPADPTGALAAAITADRSADDAAQVVVSSAYAVDLEFGTARMAARPFLRPAIAATGEQGQQIMSEAFAQAVSQAMSEFQ